MQEQGLTAYRQLLVAALKEAELDGDRAGQQRVKLMIELHDKGIAIPALSEPMPRKASAQ